MNLTRREFILASVSLTATIHERKTEMPWLSSTSHNLIKSNLCNLEAVYQSVKPGLVSAMGSQFASQPDRHIRFAFASFVAFDLKPYGQSNAMHLLDLMGAQSLDCDNYVRLAWFLYQTMVPDKASEVLAIGWEGGAFGNHAQMQIRTTGHPQMTCDPTIGLAVHGVSFDDLCAGYQCGSNLLYSIYSSNYRPELDAFNSSVQGALTGGTYRASQLLYVANRIEVMNGFIRSRLGTYPVRNEQVTGG